MSTGLGPITMIEKDFELPTYTKPTQVLIIDDDEAMVEMLRLVLDSGDYFLQVTSNALEGIKLARKILPDMIILDLLIPDMDGWEVCKTIRDFSLAPILVLSAVNKPELVAKVLDDGADDYLLKPITSSVLVSRVKRLARRARAEREAKKISKDGLSGSIISLRREVG